MVELLTNDKATIRHGQNHIIIYMRCIYGDCGREITDYMVIYGEYTRCEYTVCI